MDMAGETTSRERVQTPVPEAEVEPAPEPTSDGARRREPPAGSAGPPGKKTSRGRRWISKLTEVPVLIVLAFAIAILIKTFLVQAFFIPSGSMNPTLRVGDRVLVEKVGYRLGNPARGQVVVFERSLFDDDFEEDLGLLERARTTFRELLGLPTGRQEDYIKRIVAVGGDTIRYARSPRQLIINGDPVDEPYIRGGEDPGSPTLTGRDCERLEMERVRNACRVPAGTVFVMGDNRSNSEDSRALGPVTEDAIVGRAFTIIWPPSNVSRL